jgi:hypothetical protein
VSGPLTDSIRRARRPPVRGRDAERARVGQRELPHPAATRRAGSGACHVRARHYHGIYRGIDLSCYAGGGQLEYEFAVAPGADPRATGIELDGARGVRVDARGRLHIRLAHRTLVQDLPHVHYYSAGVRRAIGARYAVGGGRRVGFVVADHDRSASLLIDPRIAYSTSRISTRAATGAGG